MPTLAEEVIVGDLPVEGEVPAWLSGALLRVSAAHFDIGPDRDRHGVDGSGTPQRRVEHLFDGSAMLHRFGFGDGRVSYANRFLDTADRRARGAGRIPPGFGTDPCRSLFKRLVHAFDPGGTLDNTNVNLTRLGEEFIAMTETPMPIRFDPRTLATLGVSDSLPADHDAPAHTTAHPHGDPQTGEMLSWVTHFGRRSDYRLYATTPADGGPARTREVARIPVDRPSYMHSFGLTERFFVLQENPLVVNPLRLAASGLTATAFIKNFRWEPGRGCRFHVIDRATGERRGSWQTPAFFCFHHVNAWEEGDDVVVDLVAHHDASIIDQLYLDVLDSGRFDLPRTSLRRFRLRPGGAVDEQTLWSASAGEGFELPRINYAAHNGRPYRYVYGTGFWPQRADAASPSLLKLDVEAKTELRWHQDGCLPGEPVFVPAPVRGDSATQTGRREEPKWARGQATGAAPVAEDDGVILSVVLDRSRGRSFLLVLDAATFDERARASAPHGVPLSFHGQSFDD